jgi:hypothetical protein
VVFDGREQGGFSETTERSAGIEVRYSRRGETADAVIARLVAEAGAGAVVVSSDRDVAATAGGSVRPRCPRRILSPGWRPAGSPP